MLQLAHSVVEGVKSVSGVEAVLRRAKEFAEIEPDIPRHEHALAVWNRQKDCAVPTI